MDLLTQEFPSGFMSYLHFLIIQIRSSLSEHTEEKTQKGKNELDIHLCSTNHVLVSSHRFKVSV